MIKVNRYISWAIIGMFIIEALLLLFADFSQNTGVTKGVAVLYFFLTYVWFTIPAFVSVLIGNKIAKRKFILISLLCLNIIFFIRGIPMFISYLL
jgi:hypothetical protein